jgi:hypothetical protein
MQIWSNDVPRRLPGKLHLLSIEEFNKLPDGTELTSINGSVVTKGKDRIDMDTRAGYIAFGIIDPWNHPLKDLFLIFELVK